MTEWYERREKGGKIKDKVTKIRLGQFKIISLHSDF